MVSDKMAMLATQQVWLLASMYFGYKKEWLYASASIVMLLLFAVGVFMVE